MAPDTKPKRYPSHIYIIIGIINKMIVKNIFKIISKRTLVLFILLFILSLFLKSVNLIIISVSLLLTYRLLSPSISKKFFDSTPMISVLVFFSYIVLLQCMVLISWLIYHNFPLTGVPSLLLLFLLAAYGYKQLVLKEHQAKEVIGHNDGIKPQDILSSLVAIVILVLVAVIPMIQSSDYSLDNFAVSVINGNVDDSSHLGLVNDNLYFNRGVLLKSDAEGKTRNSGTYPAGWHAVSAILIKTIHPTIKTGQESLIAYAVQKLFWLFILIFLLVRVSFSTYTFFDKKKPKSQSLFWITLASLFVSYIFIVPISKEGFYSFLPQLITAVLSVPILLQLGSERSNRSFPLLLIIGVGGCLSWVLPLPAFLLSLLIIFAILVAGKKPSIVIKNAISIIKINAPIITILAIATLVQMYVMLGNNSGTTSVSFIDSILMDGGITKLDVTFYIFICIGFVASLLLTINKKVIRTRFLLILTASLLTYCLVIHVIQLRYLGKDVYYFYKMLYILVITAIPLCIAGYGLMIDKICNRSVIMAITLSIIMITTSAELIKFDGPTLGYAYGFRAFSSQMNHAIMDELSAQISEENYSNKKYSFFYNPEPTAYFQNAIAAIMVKSNMRNSSCVDNIWRSILGSPSIDKLLDDFSLYCDEYNINLITNKANLGDFEKAITQKGITGLVSVKSY